MSSSNSFTSSQHGQSSSYSESGSIKNTLNVVDVNNPSTIIETGTKSCSIACIIPAYLPNEQELIEDTLMHFLNNVDPPISKVK